MNIDGALSIASTGLANVGAQLALISQNVANAGTPDYTKEIGVQQSLAAGGQAMGVRTGAAARAIDLSLQQAAFQQDSTVAGLTTTTASLASLDSVLGTPGQGNDLGSRLGKVQDAFSALLGEPGNGASQQAVVNAAGNLTTGINNLSTAYNQQRQAAQNNLNDAIAGANKQLTLIGSLSNQLIAARSAGRSTADLENQRDAAVHTLGGLLAVKTLAQPNGDLSVFTTSGSQLPTRADTGPLQSAAATIGTGAYYPGGGIPPVLLNGSDITPQLQGGTIGATIALRDKTLPTFQAELDEFSFSLATRFDAQGLTLFTDPSGAVPAGGGLPTQSGYVGFAGIIQINPAVAANAAAIRDGTHDVVGSPIGASAFTVNPAGGPAGFTTAIDRVLKFALGAEAQPGVPQTPDAVSGLGPNGGLGAPYAATGTLAENASALVAAQSGVSAAASGQLTTEQTVQTALTAKLKTASSVNMDQEMARMIQLQTAYQANARIIGIVQTLYSQLLQAVQ